MAFDADSADFMVCVSVGAYPASLKIRTRYRLIADAVAVTRGFVRVVDESGEDYLYPRELFASIESPANAEAKTSLAKSPRSTKPVEPPAKGKTYAGLILTKGVPRAAGRPSNCGATHFALQHPARPGGPPVTPSSPRGR